MGRMRNFVMNRYRYLTGGGTQLVGDIMRINCFSRIFGQTPPRQHLVGSRLTAFRLKNSVYHPKNSRMLNQTRNYFACQPRTYWVSNKDS